MNRLVTLAAAPFLAAGLGLFSATTAAASPPLPSGGCDRPFGDSRVRCLFDTKPGDQAWTVPRGVSFVLVGAWGAQGAPVMLPRLARTAGMRGGGVEVGLDVRSGETLRVRVGRRGRSADAGGRRGQNAGGDTTLSDASGVWISAGGGAGASTWEGEGDWYDDRADTPPISVRTDRAGFDTQTDMRGKVGDGRLSVTFHQYDPDGPPTVEVTPVRGARHAPEAATFRILFSESVTGFSADDVRLECPASRLLRAAVQSAAPFDGRHYYATVLGVSADGVTASVPAGVATDDDFSSNQGSGDAALVARQGPVVPGQPVLIAQAGSLGLRPGRCPTSFSRCSGFLDLRGTPDVSRTLGNPRE